MDPGPWARFAIVLASAFACIITVVVLLTLASMAFGVN